MDAKEIVRYWLVGHQSVSSLQERGRDSKAQAISQTRESRRKKQEPQRRSRSGKEVSLSILSVKANGTGAISV